VKLNLPHSSRPQGADLAELADWALELPGVVNNKVQQLAGAWRNHRIHVWPEIKCNASGQTSSPK
jgi:hypothetical protein